MVQFLLNNISVESGPVQWQELEVNASFNDEENDVSIEIDEATFSGEEAKAINDWVEAGKTGTKGLYQGMPFSMSLSEGAESIGIFEGYLNFKQRYTKAFDGKIITKISANDDILSLEEQLQSINYGLLLEQGFIKRSDFVKEPFIVEKYEQGLEFAMLALATFLTVKETIEGVKRVSSATTDLIKAATPNAGVPPSFNTGAIISAVILVVIDVVYVALLIVYLINLLRDLLDFIYAPTRNHLALPLGTMLRAACTKLGFKFETGIDQIPNTTFVPSRPDEKENRTGIPRPEDRGYNCDEAFDIAKGVWNARLAIVNGDTVVLRAKNDPWWIKQSTLVLTDVLHEAEEFNTSEVVGNKLFTFETDSIDGWTSVEYKGTSYSVHTIAKNGANKDLIAGFNRVDFGVALAVRKDGLSILEKAIKLLAKTLDGLINSLGGNSNLADRVQNRVGMIKQTERIHSVPKLVHHTNGKVSTRDKFGAKFLYENFHSYDSFVLNNFFGQKRLFNEVTIPFCLADFIKTTKNSYFTTHDGRIGKFTNIKYRFSEDHAVADYWIREVHSQNLIEEYAEEQ